MSDVRSAGFWLFEDTRQRMARKEWAKILLEGNDTLILKGRLRRLKARNLGAGIVEVYLEPWVEFPIGNHGLGALKAAIMAEPKEKA